MKILGRKYIFIICSISLFCILVIAFNAFLEDRYISPYMKAVKAAERGDVGAQMRLAFLLENKGFDGTRNYERAAYWYERAAEQGCVDAQFKTGIMYANGRGVAKDEYKAAQWFKKTADQRNADAQFELALCIWLAMV